MVNIALGVVVIYDGRGRGESRCLFDCDSFVQGTLVVGTPNIPLDPFRICLYDHNKSIGIAFGISVITIGRSEYLWNFGLHL